MEDGKHSSEMVRVAGIDELHNSTPLKIQPWMQHTGGIPPRAAMSACGAQVDSTHGIPQGSWLIMGNNPVGLKPKD